jgi:hypothetical protein
MFLRMMLFVLLLGACAMLCNAEEKETPESNEMLSGEGILTNSKENLAKSEW